MMPRRRRHLKWPLIAAFCVALGAMGVYAVRTTVDVARWTDPARQGQSLAGWMTPRYVAHSYKLPPELVAAALGIDPSDPPRRKSLSEIAEERGVPVQSLLDALEAAIAAHRAGR